MTRPRDLGQNDKCNGLVVQSSKIGYSYRRQHGNVMRPLEAAIARVLEISDTSRLYHMSHGHHILNERLYLVCGEFGLAV